MPSLEADSHLRILNQHQQSSSPTVYNPTGSHNTHSVDLSDTLPPLPNYSYTPSAPRRPTVTTKFAPSHANSVSTAQQDDSPLNPHNFYRAHQERFGREEMIGGPGQGKIVLPKREADGQCNVRSRPTSPRTRKGSGSRTQPVSSRLQNAHDKSSNQEKSPLSATRSSPTLSITARNRQTSLKDLVNKFNQTPDEIPPIPKKTGSRSPSANSNTGSYGPGSRTASQSRSAIQGISSGSFSSDASSFQSVRYQQHRRGRAQEDVVASPKSRRNYKMQPTDSVPTKPLTSQSMVDLVPEIATLPRKPLFGEILTAITSQPNVGYGIRGPKRRRGSEGSMHSPNPMFTDQGFTRHRDSSPSSPRDWYLGNAPPLEEIKAKGDIPEPPPNLHRRTRSDFHGVPDPSANQMSFNNMSPPSSPSSTHTSSQNSYSRIPIRTRRRSTASDVGESAVKNINSISDGNTTIRASAHTRAPPPKPLYSIRTSPRYSRLSTAQKSPRYQANGGRPATSPRLTAYISSPLPKKSPPLRSSRPRQPVSTASTSASRARAVPKSSIVSDNSGNARDYSGRRPPEFGAVDFAARRQKIQQAFTKTVREEEEREMKRASMAQYNHSLESAASAEGALSDWQSTIDSSQTAGLSEGVETTETQQTSGEDAVNFDHALKIDTGPLSERSVLDLSMEDSPTLGTFDKQFTSHESRHVVDGSTPDSEIDPGSAITAGTSDSVDTFFDDEPQDESHDGSRPHSAVHPSLLTSVGDLRSSNTPSPVSAKRRNGASEPESGDDRESIQIMFNGTPVVERTPFHDHLDDKSKDLTSSDGPDSRWSMSSSWTSETKSKDERDAQLDRIDERSPSKPSTPAHLSFSTTASEHAQPVWSPASFTSPKTDRTTMDSDSYSTINRVLDHYHHDAGALNVDLLHDIQQQLYHQSPDLARQGGYDPRKVTQLMMKRITRDHNIPSSPAPESIKPHINKRTSSLTVPGPLSEKEVRDDMDEKILPTVDHKRNLSASSATHLDVDDDGNLKPARASLSRPDDFMDMSPSLGGFYERAADTPHDEEKPPLPAKDDPSIEQSFEVHERPLGNRPSQEDEFRPQLPPINFGQGDLAINIDAPRRGDSPMARPPPLPAHSPPPPPMDQNERSRHVSILYPPHTSTTEVADTTHKSRRPTASKPLKVSSISREGQSVQSEPLSKVQSSSSDQKRLTRRKHIIKELVDTEHSYGQDMTVVIDIYQETSHVVFQSSPEDVKTLFGNSAQITTFSTKFLEALKQASIPVYKLPKSKRFQRRSDDTSQSGNTGDDESSTNEADLSDEEKDRKTSIGETFAQHMPAMEKAYADYLKNQDVANKKLQQLREVQRVQIWLQQCKENASDLTSAWDLDSLLVKPVQRMLKYPLLLEQLLEVTPENHPDYTALEIASREIVSMSRRINNMKKRADIMEQVVNPNRKRKDSDMKAGLAKAFGATKKLRQQVGTTGLFVDKAYTSASETFAENFMRLQLVMRDVDMYITDIECFVNKFLDFATAMDAFIDVGHTSYPELESKWRKFRMSMRDMSTTAVSDHAEQVRKFIVQPITAVVGMYEGPQRLMHKREKRLPDYARFKAISDRGDKPDKKTAEQGEQFLAVNDALKEELPKLFSLSGRLTRACLGTFVQLQSRWLSLWKLKLKQAIEIPSATPDGDFQDELIKITKGFTADFAFYEAQVASLGLCNGSFLNETPNLVQFASPSTTSSTLTGDGVISPRAGPSFDSRRISASSDKSPVLPQPDFGGVRGSGSFFSVADAALPQRQPSTRMRASSAVSGNGSFTSQVPGSWRSYSNNITAVTVGPGRPSTATGRTVTDPSPSLRPSTEVSRTNRLSDDSTIAVPGSSYASSAQPRARSPSPNRYSGLFSSAMPMSDSPPSESPLMGASRQDFNVIFLAASVYEFNIDRARKEAGYPYLTYVAGEIFDVIGEKGELWLAKNQDDSNNQVGWIWNKHFVKLAG